MSERLELLKPVLDRFKRRFSVIDLGCGPGDLSQEIAANYDAAVFAVDRNRQPIMKNSNVTQLQVELTPSLLRSLSNCEHFDVVLAMNILHHYGEKDWEYALNIILNMGWHVVVQLPPRGATRVAGESLVNFMLDCMTHRDIQKLGEAWYRPFQHHRPIWLKTNNPVKPLPFHTLCGRTPRLRDAEYSNYWTVSASYEAVSASRHKTGQVQDPWITGMNLWNICQLHPVSPTLEEFARMIQEYPLDRFHGDIIPWNFIYDGRRLHLIDYGEREIVPDAQGIQDAARDVLECQGL